jgi:hypothetical protein
VGLAGGLLNVLEFPLCAMSPTGLQEEWEQNSSEMWRTKGGALEGASLSSGVSSPSQ